MKTIVIGAGVLGASVTYQLAKRGCEVTVIDKGIPGDAASAASFAWLNSNSKQLRPYHDLNAMSITEWAAIARELPGSSWLHMNGNVHVAGNTADAQALRERVERLHSYGYAALPVHPRELPRLDPVVPAVGHWDDKPGLYVMTMHSGVTLGAIMGRLAAEEITTGEKTKLLEGFRPSRLIEAAAHDADTFDPYAIEGERPAMGHR